MGWKTTVTRMRSMTTGIGAVFLGALPVAQVGQGRDPVPARDPALQGAIRSALQAGDEKERESSLEALRRLAGADHRGLVPQLFLFSKDATDTREAMAFGVLVEQLRIPAQDIVRSLVPLLESPDPELRRALGNVLSEFEDRSVDRGPSFSIYRPVLEAQARAGEGFPLGLVRYLYETDPGAAFLLLLRIQVTAPEELKPLLWAEHAVGEVLWKQRFGFLRPNEVEPEAVEQLRFLARHPTWWARLYAAQILSRHPAFRAAAPVEELKRDPHPLVREVAVAVSTPAQPR